MSQRKNPESNKKNTYTFKAPVSGMIYLSKRPGKKPLIEVGQSVSAGDTLCLIESMKMFTKIKANRDGIITKCHVENATHIDPSNPLFTIETSQKAKLFSLIDKQRANLNTQQSNLINKLKKLKEHLGENFPSDFENCAGKLHGAISAAFNQDKNLHNAISELDSVWMQYWNGISETYAWHDKLKGIMVGLFATLGALAGCIAGFIVAPEILPVSSTAGLAVGGTGGALFGSWLADTCFFSHSKQKLDAARKLSGKISEIKDDIELVAAIKHP